MSKPLLSIDNLIISIEGNAEPFYAVHGLSLDLYPGQTLALIGESGCGKSLSALAIMQLLPANACIARQSRIQFAEQDITNLSRVRMRALRGREIAMIFQDPMSALNPVLTIGAQISEVLRCHHIKVAYKLEVIRLLQQVGIADAARRYHAYPHELSGGMLQRVVIAMALAAKPQLLIADEPTTALDVTMQAQILHLLKAIQQQTQMAILLITHDLAVAQSLADSIAVMYAGHIVETAPAANFHQHARHPYSRALFAAIPDKQKRDYALHDIRGQVKRLRNTRLDLCRFSARCDQVQPCCQQSSVPSNTISTTHNLRCHFTDVHADQSDELQLTERESVQAREVLRIANLKVHFPIRKGLFKRTIGHVRAVDGVELSLARGQTLAIVGESGCGKTTLAHSVLQLIPNSAGRVYFNNKVLDRKSIRQHRRAIQVIFQDAQAAMNPRMLIGDIISEGLRAHRVNKRERQARVQRLLTEVGLPVESQYRYVHEFSGGEKQRICIARALALEPELIICDEPTSALDVSVQAQIINLLRRLQHRRQIAFLFITHNISVVSYLADKVAVMYLGRIVEQGPVTEVLSQPKHPYTQLLLSAVPTLTAPLAKLAGSGELPSPSQPPSGCHFHTRCAQATARCRTHTPPPIAFTQEHHAHCWLYLHDVVDTEIEAE